MKTYKIAAMVTHSGKHLETEVEAFNLWDAIVIFEYAFLRANSVDMTALSELDVSEIAA